MKMFAVGQQYGIPDPVLRGVKNADSAGPWTELTAPSMVHVDNDDDGAVTAAHLTLRTPTQPSTVWAEIAVHMDVDDQQLPAVLTIKLTPGNDWVNVPKKLLDTGVPVLRTRPVVMNDLVDFAESDQLDIWVHQAVARTQLPLPPGLTTNLVDGVRRAVTALGMRREGFDDALAAAEQADTKALTEAVKTCAMKDRRTLVKYAETIVAAMAPDNAKQASRAVNEYIETLSITALRRLLGDEQALRKVIGGDDVG